MSYQLDDKAIILATGERFGRSYSGPKPDVLPVRRPGNILVGVARLELALIQIKSLVPIRISITPFGDGGGI